LDSDADLVNLIEFTDEEIVWSMCFSPDSDKLAYGTGRGDIYVYDVKNGRSVLGPLRGYTGLVKCVLWSRDGSRLFSAGWDNTIRVLDSETGQQIK
jgi:WD40 repeat protein